MDISSAVRERINSAADTLYEETGRQTIPTVDAVRKHAKVNINDASTCMRDWRRAHSTQIEPPHLQVPDKLQQVSTAALLALWMEAVDLSNETLRLAQAGWETERAETLAIGEQIAGACAAQEAELLAAQAETALQKGEIARLNDMLASSLRRAEEAEGAASTLRAAASHIEARSGEIGKRADDLRQALDQAHATHANASSDQAALLRAQADQITSLRAELANAHQDGERNAMAARTELLKAIEEAASLRGKLEGITDAQALIKVQPRPRRQADGELGQ